MSGNYEIENVIEQLISVLEGSSQYQEYIKQQELAKNDSDLKAKIDEIRSLNFKLSNEQNADIAMKEQERLEARFDELSEDKRVYDFIQAESEFIRIYQELYKRLLDRIQFI